MRVATDQMGRRVELPSRISRIVSLVPSQTELLFHLGLGAQVAGRTHFCIHPADEVRRVPKVGGTKRFRFDAIDAIAPDLIIGNKEENYPEGIERLARGYPVWMSDIHTLEDALAMIRAVGALAYRESAANALEAAIRQRFSRLNKPPKPLPVAYLIWREPWMAAGAPTFIDHMLSRCGLYNVYRTADGRYPVITLDELAQRRPARVLLSSEPFPFKEKHAREIRRVCPSTPIEHVDGELFSWYGNRLLKAARYFDVLLNKLRAASS